MEAISIQIKELFAKADDDGRKKLQNELRDLQLGLDTNWDLLVKFGSSVS
jgi:demethylsterigmatocystin 6-O-methyltransferase